jgi:hypothetical protein
MAIQMVPLEHILPNPYRHIDRYAINEDKVERLIQSIANSSFWDGSIQGRRSPTQPGMVEIAFGHHRVEAARRAGLGQIGIVVANRSNEAMLKMMADENAEEFKHDALVTVETIGAVIEAYGRGEIALEPVHPEAPHKKVLPAGKTYSLATVARFLGWVKHSDQQATSACRRAFDAYHERATTHEALQKLAPRDRSEVAVETVVTAARSARVQATKAGLSPAKVRTAEKRAAEAAVQEVSDTGGFKARDLATTIAQRSVREVAGPKQKVVPPIEVWTQKLIHRCQTIDPYADVLTDCRRLTPFIDDLTPAWRRDWPRRSSRCGRDPRLARASRPSLERRSTAAWRSGHCGSSR